MDFAMTTAIKPESKADEAKSKKKQKTLDDTDLIEKIKLEPKESLKQKLLQLNHYNNEHIKISDNQFNVEDHEIRNKYKVHYTELFNQTRDIINSTTSIPEITEKEYKEYAISKEIAENSIKPIEDYWVKCIENAKFFTINDKDKLILNYLIDVKLISLDGLSFSLEFVFKENEYLVNNSLTKTYLFEKNQYILTSSTATEPEWKDESKDPSKKRKVKKVKKGKSRETHTITQDVESFFDLFKKEASDQEIDETEVKFIKEDLIPNSLEYYLNIIEIHDEDHSDSEDECEHNKHKH